MKNKTTLVLAHRINEIEKQINELELEYNLIVKELCERMPSLKDDVNLKPKVLKKELKK